MVIIVFDVNETLLSLDPLKPIFEDIFGSADLRDVWFKDVLQIAMVTTITGRSQSLTFVDVARIALDKLTMRENIELSDKEKQSILEVMRSLPPHEDTLEGIRALHKADVRLAVLTNSPQATVDNLMQSSGIAPYLDKILSVEAVGKFKPTIEVYRMAQAKLNESVENLWLVAAHDWDIEGALNAGWHGAFIQREGKVIHPDAPKPDTIHPTIRAFAEWFIETQAIP